jgi:hypothetical protein
MPFFPDGKLSKKEDTLVDLVNHLAPTAARPPDKSRDIAILVSVGLLGAALIIVVLASVLPLEVNPADLAMIGYPYP